MTTTSSALLKETVSPSFVATTRARVLAAVAGYSWQQPATDRDRAVWATCQALNGALTAEDAAQALRLVAALERRTGRAG